MKDSLKQAALPGRQENPGPPDELSRRNMLKLAAGASAALLVGTQGCERKPQRKIVSRVDGPEYQKPGRALYYSSTFTDGPWPYGLLIKTVDGRPIKVDGNPDDPVARGASTPAMQASILSLYDPDRAQSPRSGGKQVSWDAADRQIVDALRNATSVALMTRSTLGPAERGLVRKFLARFPNGRHLVHETVSDMPRRRAWNEIYGVDGEWLPRVEKARVIVALDADFLSMDGAALESVRAFAGGRTALNDREHAAAEISRLYVLESAMTLTGSNADHRLRLRPSAMGGLAQALRQAVSGHAGDLEKLANEHQLDPAVLHGLVDDLRAHAGEVLVLAGAHLPSSVHASVALLNEQLDARGNTLEWNVSPAPLPVTDPAEVEAVLTGGVDVLICLSVNPLYDWPGGDFHRLLSAAGLSVGHGQYLDETGSACSVSLPSHHMLESWNDAVARNAGRMLCQPVIAPLFDTRQEAESLLRWTQALVDATDPLSGLQDWHDFLQQEWPQDWEESLRVGGGWGRSLASAPALDRQAAERMAGDSSAEHGDWELLILPHHTLHDGRFANSSWLQELPDPVSKLVWDNAASVSPASARQLGVSNGEMLALEVGGRSLELPALIQPGMADGVVATTLGHGRTIGGYVALEAGGVNVAPLLGRENPSVPRLAQGAQVRRGVGSRELVRTQKQFDMHDRPIVLDGTLEEYRQHADFVKHKKHHAAEGVDMYEPYDYSKGHKWAMAIDLAACTGCGICTAACQAENNIPVVGRDQVSRGREMHWMRLDRYHVGDPDNPGTIHSQPMTCQHCDNAPCENVCPVNATAHSPEGLNEMTYNRCVGTRYCANNCPYKVRRFNFLRYQEARLKEPVQELVFNPQVTVRGIGVMEKCTFCVQRINEAKFTRQNRGESIVDGDVQPACQQACPAKAISFGDANDPQSRVAAQRASARAFHVLEDLNVKPNITYLARVRNPSDRAGGKQPDSHEGHGGDEG